MSKRFPVHTPEIAPGTAKPTLKAVAARFGFVHNLLGIMASSPALTPAYLSLSEIFEKQTMLTPTERQLVLLVVSRFHECRFCIAAHSLSAEMQQVPAEAIQAIRNDLPIADERLEALRRFVVSLLEHRGWQTEQLLEACYAAGYTASQLLDILVGMAQKRLSNFTNHIAATPLGVVMTGHRWVPLKA